MRPLQFHGNVPAYLERNQTSGKLIVVEGTDGVGRSTHMFALRQWLEIQGYAVADTGWTRSELVGKTIDKAKSGHTLSPLTFTLLYACDFADRLEREILPALAAGYIVLSDRYVYTAWARALVRGLEADWVHELFSFAPLPDLVLYLRVDVETLARRVLLSSGIDHWEAGRDRSPDLDIYDSFTAYQSDLLLEFDRMAAAGNFCVVDARAPIEQVQGELRGAVSGVLPRVDLSAPGA